MDVKPAVLDGGREIVLANWPNNKHVICNDSNNIPIKIPSHPYVLINRTVLCNCQIEVEDNFMLESIAACPDKHILQNWTMHEQVLSISLQAFDFDSKLLEAPKTLKDFVYQYQQKK